MLERRSQLGTQLHHAQRGAKPRSPREVEKDLAAAWAQAENWLAARPEAWSGAAREAEVIARVGLARGVAEDPDAPLHDAERAVLLAIAAEHEQRGLLRVTIPKRRRAELAAEHGVTEWAARKAVERLAVRGVVEIVSLSRGRAGNPATGARARAAMYALNRARLESLAAAAEQERRRAAIMAELAALDAWPEPEPARPRLRLVAGGAA